MLPWLIGAAVLAVGLLLVDRLPVGTVHDDAMYVILAKALATGRGYHWIHIPGAPPATHFPPGYPAVLALLWKAFPVFPQNTIAFKILNAIFLAAAAAGLGRFATSRLGFRPWTAFIVAVAGALAIPAVMISTLVLSEPMFLALLIPLLLVAERVAHPREGDEARPIEIAALGVAAGALTLVRSHGIALVAGLGLVLFLRRRWRDLVTFGAAACVTMLPWQLWVASHEGHVPAPMRGNYESYTPWLVRGFHEHGAELLLQTVQHTSRDVLTMLAGLSDTMLPPAANAIVLAIMIAVCAIGSGRLVRRAPVSAAFLGIYLAIVLARPFNPVRFTFTYWAPASASGGWYSYPDFLKASIPRDSIC